MKDKILSLDDWFARSEAHLDECRLAVSRGRVSFFIDPKRKELKKEIGSARGPFPYGDGSRDSSCSILSASFATRSSRSRYSAAWASVNSPKP